jgi:hypothetical protein
MSIFAEYGGKGSYYTAEEEDRLFNPEKYDYTQETYDAFVAQVGKKADARQKAEEAAMDAIPYSYVGRGTGATNPAFSFGGYSGHTSGGTAGLAGFSSAGSPVGVSTIEGSSGGGGGGGGGGGRRNDGGDVQRRAEGGVIQYMQEGGMIKSPYADPMKPTMQAMPVARSGPIISDPLPMPMEQMGMSTMEDHRARIPSPGIGGAFESLQQKFGQQMGMMQASPLRVYQNYLMQTYAQPEMQAQQQKVDHFLDLVDQAERAHFGAEESFGYGGGPMAQQYMPQPQAQTPMDRGIASLPAAF